MPNFLCLPLFIYLGFGFRASEGFLVSQIPGNGESHVTSYGGDIIGICIRQLVEYHVTMTGLQFGGTGLTKAPSYSTRS